MPPLMRCKTKRKNREINISLTPWPTTRRHNNPSLFWMSLCACCCKPWVLTTTGWELEAHSLNIASAPATQELIKALIFFCLLDGLNLASDSSEWHAKQPAGCESPPSPFFLTFQICLAKSQFPPPASTPLCSPVQLNKIPNEKQHSFPIFKGGPKPSGKNIPINTWTLNDCSGSSAILSRV